MSRIYDIDGEEFVSVTTVTGILDKPALKAWACRCMADEIAQGVSPDDAVNAYERASEHAMYIGSKVHRAIQAHIYAKRRLRITHDHGQIQKAYEAFLDWEKSSGVKWLESEVRVCNKHQGYAGRLDAIAEIDGVKYVIDFKTANACYPEYKMQIAAYCGALNIERGAVLLLDKETGIPKWQEVKNIKRYYLAFIRLVEHYYLSADRKINNKYNEFIKSQYGGLR